MVYNNEEPYLFLKLILRDNSEDELLEQVWFFNIIYHLWDLFISAGPSFRTTVFRELLSLTSNFRSNCLCRNCLFQMCNCLLCLALMQALRKFCRGFALDRLAFRLRTGTRSRTRQRYLCCSSLQAKISFSGDRVNCTEDVCWVYDCV